MWLIKASLRNPYMVATLVFMILVLGVLCRRCTFPMDILPVFNAAGRPGASPTTRACRPRRSRRPSPTASSAGSTRRPGAGRVESKSVPGVSVVKIYFRDDIDPNARPDHDQLAGPGHAADAAAQYAAAGGAAVRPDRHHAAGHPHRREPATGRGQRQGRGPHRRAQHARRGARLRRPRGGRRQGPHRPHLPRPQEAGSPQPVAARRGRGPASTAT